MYNNNMLPHAYANHITISDDNLLTMRLGASHLSVALYYTWMTHKLGHEPRDCEIKLMTHMASTVRFRSMSGYYITRFKVTLRKGMYSRLRMPGRACARAYMLAPPFSIICVAHTRCRLCPG